MAKKVAASSKSAKGKKAASAGSREQKLLKDLETRAVNIKGGARKRAY